MLESSPVPLPIQSVRRLVLILLMIMLPWHASASLVGTGSHDLNGAVLHAVEHDLRIAHHHHDDGTMHYGESDASQEHLADNMCSAAVMLLQTSAFTCLSLASIAPPAFSLPFLSSPDSEGLRRPPRTSA